MPFDGNSLFSQSEYLFYILMEKSTLAFDTQRKHILILEEFFHKKEEKE